MPTTTAPSIRLPYAQWRLMNLIAHPQLAIGRKVKNLLGVVDASVDDVVKLHLRGLIYGELYGERYPVDYLEHDPRMIDVHPLQVKLTPDGVRWITENAGNCIVTVLRGHDRGHGVPMPKVLADADVARQDLQPLADDHLIQVLTAAGRETRAAGTVYPPHTLRVRLTQKGKRLLP